MESLILARHGLAGSNRDGIASCAVPGEGLVPEGVEQARALRGSSQPRRMTLAATTELARTQQTLALALEGRDVGVIVVPELNEIHFGSFDGGSLDTYRTWAAARSPDERAPGGGESRADAAARFARGLRTLLARDEDAILLVGHALMLRYTLDASEGRSYRRRAWRQSRTRSRIGSSARTSSARPSSSSRGASRQRFARERPLPLGLRGACRDRRVARVAGRTPRARHAAAERPRGDRAQDSRLGIPPLRQNGCVSALSERVEESVRRHDLITPGGEVTCLVSGGADSTCLWHVLRDARVSASTAVHVDHGLRGAESDADARFCRGRPRRARSSRRADVGGDRGGAARRSGTR